MALYGIRVQEDGSSINDSVVKLNHSCLGCQNEQAGVYKMFKTACLSYKASPVTFEQRDYPRNELISLQKFLSGELFDHMLNLEDLTMDNKSTKI